MAYEKIDGSPDLPTLLYIPGYGSGKDGDKVEPFPLLLVKEEGKF